ncbi:MAG: hypothetical protein ACYT04_34470 [Nostoc sp.]
MLIVNSESLGGDFEVRSLFLTNHRGAEEGDNRRSHAEDFTGDRFFISRRDAEEEESDRTLEILQAIAFLTNHRDTEEESDRTVEILQAIAFLSHAKKEESDRTLEILQAMPPLRDATRTAGYANGGLRLRSF